MPAPEPSRLGRAIPLGRYAKLMAPAIGLSDEHAEKMIRTASLAGAAPGRRETRLLRRAPIGGFVVWATFNERDPAADPFAHLPRTTEAIRTALGLGTCPETETLILITWLREGPHATLSLHRPTVADAEMFPWYRPHTDPPASWGLTVPLQPNPGRLTGCPEIVHRQIAGETLLFPVWLTV